MLKPEFINKLSSHLHYLAPLERNRAIEYYSELISDKVENGMAEEDVIAEFGDIGQLANTILEENNFPPQKKKSKWDEYKVLIIVLLVLGSPILFGLAMGALGVLIGIAATVFSLVIALVSTCFAFGVSGIAAFISSFTLLPTNPSAGIFQMGTGLVLIGSSVLLTIGCVYLLKLLIKLIIKLVKYISNGSKRRSEKRGA